MRRDRRGAALGWALRRRLRGARAVGVALSVASSGCGAGTPRESGSPPERSHVARSASGRAGASHGGDRLPRAVASAGPEPRPSVSAMPAEPATVPEPCPRGMLPVDGEACASVEQRCARNWYDAALRRRVCVEYAGPSRCLEPRAARFCVDAREAGPAGAVPDTGMGVFEAQVECARRGARLCTASEWALACEGPERLPFPYGWVRASGRCNVDRVLRGPARSGDGAARAEGALALLVPVDRASCPSAWGVEALGGNAGELVALEREAGPGGVGAIAGGLPLLGEQNGCRSLRAVADEDRSALVGYRCCAEPDGRATEPRTPLQVARGWSFERVERLARSGGAAEGER